MISVPDRDILCAKIAAIREIYNLIDKKIPLFIDAETSLEDGLEMKTAYESKYNNKEIVLYCIPLCVALLLPLSLLSVMFSAPLYYASPVVAAGLMIYLRNNYKKKKLPVLLKAAGELISNAELERDNLCNVINQSYYGINAEMGNILKSTDDEEFIENINIFGYPPECKNIIALDYMYQAVSLGHAYPFSDAIKHFAELKEKLKDREDENSKELYKEITEGELKAEYRDCVIARCKAIDKEQKAAKLFSEQDKRPG